MLVQRDTSKRMVGITLALRTGVGPTSNQRLSWSTEQNDIGLTWRHLSTSGQQNCRKNASVGPTNDCYLGRDWIQQNNRCHQEVKDNSLTFHPKTP